MRDVTLESVCSLFRFEEHKEELHWLVRELLGRRKDYGVGTALVAIMKLYDKFDVEDIFVRLIQGDLIQVLKPVGPGGLMSYFCWMASAFYLLVFLSTATILAS